MASPSLGEANRVGARHRRLSRSLSGYLCGTHSGWLGRRRGDRLDRGDLGAGHRALGVAAPADMLRIGAPWQPAGEATGLAGELATLLDHHAIVDLLVFGSQAGGAPTGFSDLDAVLVIENEAAEDGATLRALRPRVLAAQRALLAHQPMQHHGFEVATPKLMGNADAALELPREALDSARSLLGRPLEAGFSGHGSDPAGRLASMACQLSALSAWPRHPWSLHGAVSMFELLPALFLQGMGVAVSKANSFEGARAHFEGDWWPYDVLEQVREVWPRRRNPPLELATSAARNPWVAVAAWTRLPSAWPAAVRPLLSADCLKGLRDLARLMAGATR